MRPGKLLAFLLCLIALPALAGNGNGNPGGGGNNRVFSLNTSPLLAQLPGTVVQVANANGTLSRIEVDAFGASAHVSLTRIDGTAAAPTAILSGDVIGGPNAWGYNGTGLVGPKAAIDFVASQNWSASANGTQINFWTTLNSTTTAALDFTIGNDGGLFSATATGGDKGSGTINMTGCYVNNVPCATGNVSSALSSLTSATGGNTLSNTGAQAWSWPALGTITALSLSGTTTQNGAVLNATLNGVANTGYGGYFSNTSTSGWAGYFNGRVNITGPCFGCSNVPVNIQTGNYTLTANDGGGVVILNSGSAGTFTFPAAGLSYTATGTTFGVVDIGAGALTLTPNSPSVFNGMVLTSGSIALSQYGYATCVSDGTNWDCGGNPAGTSSSGNVNSGTAPRAAYYATSGTAISSYSGMNFTTTGVGIGTATPAYALDIQGTSQNILLSVKNSFAESAAGFLSTFQLLAPNIATTASTNIGIGVAAATNNEASIGFYYAGSGSTSNRLDLNFFGTPPLESILASGNVGIGQTNPATTLDVNGDITMETGTAGAILCLTSAHALGHCTAAASCTGTCTCTCAAN